jgi:O-succinylbenzoate synthase
MNLNFYTYKFLYKNPFKSAKDIFTHRRGFILTLQKNGITALGEAAPLAGFSSETTDEVEQQLRKKYADIASFFDHSFTLSGLMDFAARLSLLPSIQFGLFTMGAAFLAQKEQKSLHQYIFIDAPNRIPINAVIDLNTQDVLKKIQEYTSIGYETIKLKAGCKAKRLITKLEKIRHNYPDLNIRIDANQSWSVDEAKNIFDQIEPLTIEYCEEPLAEPNRQSLNALRNYSSIPIALDESLASNFELTEAAQLADVLIIKPMVLGCRKAIKQLEEIAQERNPKIVFTSSLESGIGRLMTASIAAGLGSNLAHGLGTGPLLAEDVWRDDQFISDGNYHLPDGEKLTELMNAKLESRHIQEIKIYHE